MGMHALACTFSCTLWRSATVTDKATNGKAAARRPRQCPLTPGLFSDGERRFSLVQTDSAHYNHIARRTGGAAGAARVVAGALRPQGGPVARLRVVWYAQTLGSLTPHVPGLPARRRRRRRRHRRCLPSLNPVQASMKRQRRTIEERAGPPPGDTDSDEEPQQAPVQAPPSKRGRMVPVHHSDDSSSGSGSESEEESSSGSEVRGSVLGRLQECCRHCICCWAPAAG